MILGAGVGQLPLIEYAKKAGCYVIAVSPKGDYPGFAIADECLYADISDKEIVLQMAKDCQIEAIATDQTDISVPTLLYVAQALGLPQVECTDVNNFRYKSRMREVCRAQGLPTIASCVTNNLEEAKSFFNNLPTPMAIIKPVDSQGSRGVTKVHSESELESAFAFAMGYSRRKEIIIEQFIDGQEIEVDTIVKDGEVKAILIGDVFNFHTANTFSAYERIYPTAYDDTMQQRIRDINFRTLTALGIRTGWTHGEYIVSKDGEVYLIEVGIRGGGNYIGSYIVKTMLGFGTYELAFMAAMGDNSFYDTIALQPMYAAYKCFCLPAGVIESVNIDQEFFQQDCIICHDLDRLYEGKETESRLDKNSRLTVVIKASTREELRRYIDAVPKHISVKVRTEKGLESEFWI